MIGISIPTMVINMLNKTVFLRPILFIREAVGMERRRNHRNTIDGKKPDARSVKLKSVLTYEVAMPTTSTNPITKKAKKMG